MYIDWQSHKLSMSEEYLIWFMLFGRQVKTPMLM